MKPLLPHRDCNNTGAEQYASDLSSRGQWPFWKHVIGLPCSLVCLFLLLLPSASFASCKTCKSLLLDNSIPSQEELALYEIASRDNNLPPYYIGKIHAALIGNAKERENRAFSSLFKFLHVYCHTAASLDGDALLSLDALPLCEKIECCDKGVRGKASAKGSSRPTGNSHTAKAPSFSATIPAEKLGQHQANNLTTSTHTISGRAIVTFIAPKNSPPFLAML